MEQLKHIKLYDNYIETVYSITLQGDVTANPGEIFNYTYNINDIKIKPRYNKNTRKRNINRRMKLNKEYKLRKSVNFDKTTVGDDIRTISTIIKTSSGYK